MPSLLRSLPFLFLVGMFVVVHSLHAEGPPPLPRPNVDNPELNSLGNIMSSQRVMNPQVAATGSSVRTANHDEEFSGELSPPNLHRQASFHPTLSAFSDAEHRERQSEKQAEHVYDEESERRAQEAVEAFNPLLDGANSFNRGSRDSRDGYEDDGENASGWTNPLGKPSLTPLFSIVASLCIVLGAFFILALLLRKVSPQGNLPLPKDAFECLGRYFLTQKHQLQVLRLGNRIVLVSVMPDGISTLAEITDPNETAAFLGLCRRLDTAATTDVFRRAVASMSEEESTRPHNRPVVAGQRGQLDLYSDPDESLASILAARGRGRGHGR